jgi:Protein of unknown function (DUF3995)
LRYLAWIVALLFAALSAIHIYWAMGGRRGAAHAVPEIDGEPLFRPGAVVTLVVAGLLAVAATLVLQRAGLAPPFGPRSLRRAAVWILAATLAVRAIGDFNYVGFFKRRRETRFAYLDTRVYSPLALGLGLGTAIVAACRDA